jgi:predicted ATPase with chaperone activity
VPDGPPRRGPDARDIASGAPTGRRALYREAELEGRVRLPLSALTAAPTGEPSDRVLKVARTIADLAGADQIGATRVAEALPYRMIE